MRLLDFICPECRAIARDLHVPLEPAMPPLRVVCTAHPYLVPMVRLYPAVPQIWHTGGRGG